VARALAPLHGPIARGWSTNDPGREVGLSRSALADRFVRMIGVPPIRFLAQWRLQVAARILRGTNSSTTRIAERVGYQSEAAFSRAFNKAFGAAPAT
jgi:AraC-like DNA-binding protein